MKNASFILIKAFIFLILANEHSYSYAQVTFGQVTNYGSLGFSDAQVIPDGTAIHNIAYDGFAGESKFYPRAKAITSDVSTTKVRFYTTDGSEFAFNQVDYLIDTQGSPPMADITFYGFKNGSQVVAQNIAVANLAVGTAAMSDALWEDVDEVKIISNTNSIFFDNLSVGPASSLPVDLIYFGCECKDAGTQLTWQTASEMNNSHFIVQKMNDYGEFENIETKSGAGNSSSLNIYRYMDLRPESGTYYKLVQVANDGTRTETNIFFADDCSKDENKIIVKSNFIELRHTINTDENMEYRIASATGNIVEEGFVNLKSTENKVTVFNYNNDLKGIFYIHIVSDSINLFERIYLK